MLFIVSIVFVQTLLFYREDFYGNFLVCGLGMLYYIAIRAFLSGHSGVRTMSFALITCSALICFEPLYYRLVEPEGSLLLQIFQTRLGRLQAWGLWGNANETAFIACLGIGNLLLLSNLEKSKKLLLVSIPLASLFITVVLMTLSRAGMASLFLIFSVYIWKSKRKLLKTLLVVMVIAGIVIIPSLMAQRVDAEGSSNERFDLRYQGTQLFKEHPLLGVGFNRARYQTGGMALHCTYIQAFSELGIFGGGALVVLIWSLFKKNLLIIKRTKEFVSNIAYNELVYSISGLYLSGLFYLYFGNQLLTILFFSFFGLISNFTDFCFDRQSKECGNIPNTENTC